MKDSEVSRKRNKVFPRERPPLIIEKTSRVVPAADMNSQNSTMGQRLTLMSLPRVKWLEREEKE